jgi:hypothetical protein
MSQIKDTLKKSVLAWKVLHSQIIKNFSEYQNRRDADVSVDKSRLPWIKEKMLNIMRFQIQMLSAPALFKKYQADEKSEILNRFKDSVCSCLTENMLRYFTICKAEKDGKDLSDFANLKITDILIQSTAGLTEPDLKDLKLDLYWLEVTSMTPDQVKKARVDKSGDGSKTLTIKTMMSMNNSKKSYKEYCDFALSFGNYYERYFTDNEANDSKTEILRNFGRLVCLFMKGFVIPGRQKIEDMRQTFMYLFRIFRLEPIVSTIRSMLKDCLMKKVVAEGGPHDEVLEKELRVLLFNLFKMTTFSLFAIELDSAVFSDLSKTLLFLGWQVLTNFEFFRLGRVVHMLMHKPSICQNIENAHWPHQALFDYDLRLLLCNTAINLIKSPASESDLQVKMAEKELLQLYRCLYCKMLSPSHPFRLDSSHRLFCA